MLVIEKSGFGLALTPDQGRGVALRTSTRCLPGPTGSSRVRRGWNGNIYVARSLSVLSFTLAAVSMSACAIPGSAGLISRAAAVRMMEAREPCLGSATRAVHKASEETTTSRRSSGGSSSSSRVAIGRQRSRTASRFWWASSVG